MTDKERLEEVKNVRWENLRTSQILHVKWLIQQAERVQELESEIKTHAPHGRNYTNEQVVKIRMQNKRYREAIKKAISHFNYDEHQQGMAELQEVLEESKC